MRGEEREEITMLTTWRREESRRGHWRCPLCAEFPAVGTAIYRRLDAAVWVCEECWEWVFGAGDE